MTYVIFLERHHETSLREDGFPEITLTSSENQRGGLLYPIGSRPLPSYITLQSLL